MSNVYKIMNYANMTHFILADFSLGLRRYMITVELDVVKFEKTDRDYTISVLRKEFFSKRWDANGDYYDRVMNARFEQTLKKFAADGENVLRRVNSLDPRKRAVLETFLKGIKEEIVGH